MKVRANEVPEFIDYIIEGKEYEVAEDAIAYQNGVPVGGSFLVEDDFEIYAYFASSFHLAGAAWEVLD